MAKRSSNKYLNFYYNEVLPFVVRNGIVYNHELWENVKLEALESGRITQKEFDEWTPPFNVHFYDKKDLKRNIHIEGVSYKIPTPVYKYIYKLIKRLRSLGVKIEMSMIDEDTYQKALLDISKRKRGRRFYDK